MVDIMDDKKDPNPKSKAPKGQGKPQMKKKQPLKDALKRPQGVGGLAYAHDPKQAHLDEVTKVLKEIGSEEKHCDQVAEIVVGLEGIDDKLIGKYTKFVESLEPHNREKLFKAILKRQNEVYESVT